MCELGYNKYMKEVMRLLCSAAFLLLFPLSLPYFYPSVLIRAFFSLNGFISYSEGVGSEKDFTQTPRYVICATAWCLVLLVIFFSFLTHISTIFDDFLKWCAS